MKRNITFRRSFLVLFFALQVFGILIGKFSDARFFCWAPYDQFSFYEINVSIDGQALNDQEVSQRYRREKEGRNNRSIHNIISNVRQYEETYGSDENAVVEIHYEVNGHKKAAWLWPEDTIVSK